MSSSPARGDAPEAPPRAYRLVSANYQNKEYPEGVLRVNEAGNEIELRQWAGKKKAETVIARFRLEPNADVRVDGAFLRVSELSVTLESPGDAEVVADRLRRPARELEASRLVSEAEASVSGFLEVREEALNLLSRIKVDPRGAIFAADSAATTTDVEPLEAVYSTFSARLAESLEKMKSSLAGGEKVLGSGANDWLYAFCYTVGAVQNALFAGDSDLVQEVAALKELGIATTSQELRTEKQTARLMLQVHPTLAGLASSQTKPS